ncbi:LEAF RUST 10 DISEASE-RESISTANCE LOCUS RECEPTOR-LIKE PROTEIN KINASE-like 1.2 isoform X4 [Ziziphus jujuba]|uniref:non-specific serine/threonine protein kinase n=1 Tax=Ziziphus jujuba TaxID=326968 RepID=A0ABM3ZXX3_ZIZJJ|nr:LEAF RUST 10 DISEASE-RESISTANCE LOCUS RECEPTOR-LIKE PROTEIN KINASE-like 1.2 isoform X4 [Ziziphus jujuba]
MRLHKLFYLDKSIQVSILIFSFTLPVESVVPQDSRYEDCKPRNCGSGPEIRYPFYIHGAGVDFCGQPGFKVVCMENKPMYWTSRGPYIINDISYENQSMRVVAAEHLNATCFAPSHKFSIGHFSPFTYSSKHAYLQFFYGCDESFSLFGSETFLVSCASNSSYHSFFTLVPKFVKVESCMADAYVPVDLEGDQSNQTIKTVDYVPLLKSGFTLEWYGEACGKYCTESGGRCGHENGISVCYCRDGTHSAYCNRGDGGSRKWKLGLGIGVGFLGLFLIAIFIICCYKKRRASSNIFSRSTTDPYLNTDVEGGSCYFGVPVFPFNDLAKATNNFASEKELGDGGFGSVYHGKLKDGREVAVKRLYEHNYKRVEQFMNEIEILTRLRHRNLVSLYGCTSRHSRELLLVYEYIPNGTVADHLHGEQAKPGLLPWSIRMSIAIETATALAYLHASEIVHRDVKTNNILLDNNFTVKVADFGLSRLFPNDVTHVSTAPQGTPGYVDPEYHQCYQLTSKSDVYSFGVVLIELISSLPAVDITRHRHEINLANLATSKIQKCEFHELIDPSTGFETDSEVRRMTIAVAELAFQCLQQNKEMRPSMEEVLETLKSIESREDSPDENQEKEFDDIRIIKSEQPPPPSPECDEVGLLKNMRPPASPISVTHKWPSTRSITPNVSG